MVPEYYHRTKSTIPPPQRMVGEIFRSEVFQADCFEILRYYPDEYFDLVIADPPYGIGAGSPSKKPSRAKQKNGTILHAPVPDYGSKKWDDKPFSYDEYLELKRVSRYQIIWGCNFFDFQLPGSRLIWDKMNDTSDQFDAEIAYRSWGNRIDIIHYKWHGFIQGVSASRNFDRSNIQQGNKAKNERRIHPTQKPVNLYEWIFREFAEAGWKILDPYLGSGSSRIAADLVGLDFTGMEKDREYFDLQEKRWLEYSNQPRLF